MKKYATTLILLLAPLSLIYAQLNPAITSWLQNTTETGHYYMAGNATPIANGILVNCQLVEYSQDYVYVHATGIPAYPTGPFLDGNPSQASNQDVIFKYPLAPQANTGAAISTNGGNIGAFINGVALFDFRDGTSWDTASNRLCGGPGNPPCPGPPGTLQSWNRDAIPAEMAGFDCSKAHPAMGNYHHHQNPSAFKLDLTVVSDICNLYDADGLYAIDPDQHSPLIGYAYDGFPIYGAYGFQNQDGTGGVVRIKSGYQLRNITARTHWADGTNVPDGPAINGTYYLGYFREDYEFIEHPTEQDYLDQHNGRFCVTPQYPNGIYAYFATVDEQWNSFYPYAVGPTFYGLAQDRVVTSVNENTIIYDNTLGFAENDLNRTHIEIIPNPASDLIAIQLGDLITCDVVLDLFDSSGKQVRSSVIKKGSTISYFDVQTLYDGAYFIRLKTRTQQVTKKVMIKRE
ncbi:MAG: hypothetical protein ABR84_04985 [Cryomorphaceae bacterium BACL21 MAG-121220-bin10]|jgi:hypothetical protein|nr:MAG: hypothetical protein ABR84_04985 [Cryomorphaceae bacterium BACL21 MAG-121220-bin10]MDA0700946.1 YHYH protein [Bacteroidota bacterium]|tara:strand:+ start:8336 stop:9712 length:1377 start_codon:yes stop_codon:yes gene_type:complete